MRMEGDNDNNTIDGHQTNCRVKMGETIREIREKKGYNQEQLASIMKISRSTISKIESGKFNCSLYRSKYLFYSLFINSAVLRFLNFFKGFLCIWKDL